MNSIYDELLETIVDDKIKELVKETVLDYGTEDKAKDAKHVSAWLTFLLRNDKLIADNNYALFVDVLMAAAITHNITYKYGEFNIGDLFKIRLIMTKINKDKSIGVPETYLESILQAIEGQLGKDHPMVLLIPNPNTPGMHFALACAIYYKTNNTIK